MRLFGSSEEACTVPLPPRDKSCTLQSPSSSSNQTHFVALDDAGQVVGGAGIAELEGIEDCAELQKLYLDDSAKGKGCGKELMRITEEWARSAGYKKLYLETHSRLTAAVELYEKLGFRRIEKPSQTNHGTMDLFYIKRL